MTCISLNVGSPPLRVQVIHLEDAEQYHFSSWRQTRGPSGPSDDDFAKPERFDSQADVEEFFDSKGWLVDWESR
jgi:hypothetical protein